MKKIIVVMFLVISLVLFFSIVKSYEDDDHTFLMQIETKYRSEMEDRTILRSDFRLIFPEDTVAPERFYRFLKDLVYGNDLLVTTSLGDAPHGKHEFYMMADTPMDRRLGLMTNTSLNFFEDDGAYYTNQSDEEQDGGVFFYLTAKRYKVHIYPMTRLDYIPQSNLSLFSESKDVLDQATRAFQAEYGDFVEKKDANAVQQTVDDAIREFLPMTLVLVLLTVLLVVMMDVLANSKKIAIMKTLGTSVFAAGLRLFLPLVLVVTGVVLVVNALLFLFRIGVINERTLHIMGSLAKANTLLLLGFVVVIGVSCLLLTFIPTYSLLKNSRFDRTLMNVNIALKIAVIIFLVPGVSGMLAEASKSVKIMRYANEPSVAHYQYAPRLTSRYQSISMRYAKELISLTVKYTMAGDPSIVDDFSLVAASIDAYEKLNDAGALYCRSETIQYTGDMWHYRGQALGSGAPGLRVNENYLRTYPLVDVSGEIIDMDAIDADIVIFCPKGYDHIPDDFLTPLPTDRNTYQYVTISDKQNLHNLDVFGGVELYDFIRYPLVITLYKDTTFRPDASPTQYVFFDGDIRARLRDTIFYDKIDVTSLAEGRSYLVEYERNHLTDNLRFSMPILFLVMMIVAQYAYLYVKVYAKQLYVRKLLGHGPYRMMLRLFVESSLAVFVALVVVMLRHQDIRIFIVLLAMDVLGYLLAVESTKRIPAHFDEAGTG